ELRGSSEQITEGGAGTAEQARERNARKVKCLCRTDARIRRDKVQLGLAQVGAPFENLRRQSLRHARQRQLFDGLAAWNGPRIAPENYRECILDLSLLLFQWRYCGEGYCVFRLRL